MARGLFAELNRIAKQAAKETERANRRAEAERLASMRKAEAANKQASRAQAQDQKRREKEAKQAYVDAQMAAVEEMNAELAGTYQEIDTLLLTALKNEHALDLESLRATVVHPPFDRPELEAPTPKPVPAGESARPILNLPAAPTGLSALLGKRKYEQQAEAAKLAHEQALEAWVSAKFQQKQDFEQAIEDHQAREAERLEALAAEKQRYAEECGAREAQVAERNQALDQLIADLGYGVPEAIEEYVSIVLENSDYPECFPTRNESSFDPATAELALRVLIPPPDALPTIKAHKYAKAKDEISATQLSQKACKDRYADAVHQVALRSLHEVFRADRRGLINTITLEVGTETIDPATGHEVYIPFVATGAERETFMGFDLAGVMPAATLKHMGASVSKNPFGLEGTDTSGIRGA